MRKQLKLSSDGGDCGSMKCKRGYGRAFSGLCSLNLEESGVRRSVLCWCVSQDSGFTYHECVFTFNFIILVGLFDNSVQKVPFPFTLTLILR
jgi:hypothetical protein